MPELTIFTAPKPFTNPHIATIQRNAIQSWVHLGSEVEVLLIGDEPGMTEFVQEYQNNALDCSSDARAVYAHHNRSVVQLPNVKRNNQGTPLVSSIFALARQACQSPLLAYVNADVILMPDFLTAVRQALRCSGALCPRANFSRPLPSASRPAEFLIIGQRWDLDMQAKGRHGEAETTVVEFSAGWDSRLRAEVAERGRLHAPAGSDYFVFPRSLFVEMPDFAIGRAGWDNWMIYHARQQGWPVIDGTPSIMAIHQDHDYSHLPGGKPHYELPESQQNQNLAGGIANLYIVLDSDYQLKDGKLRRPEISLLRAIRRVEVWLMPSDNRRKGIRWSLARQVRRMRRRLAR